jgi:hypothetical protein
MISSLDTGIANLGCLVWLNNLGAGLALQRVAEGQILAIQNLQRLLDQHWLHLIPSVPVHDPVSDVDAEARPGPPSPTPSRSRPPSRDAPPWHPPADSQDELEALWLPGFDFEPDSESDSESASAANSDLELVTVPALGQPETTIRT